MSVTLRQSDRDALKACLEADYGSADEGFRALIDTVSGILEDRQTWIIKIFGGVHIGPVYGKTALKTLTKAIAQPCSIVEVQPYSKVINAVNKHEALVNQDNMCPCGHSLDLHFDGGCKVRECNCEAD